MTKFFSILVISMSLGCFSGLFGYESIIPEGTTIISKSQFLDDVELTSIVIPESVIRIEEHAFDGCINLVDIDLPDGVTSIGNYAFANCAQLSQIKLPQQIQSIGSYAFSGCTSLADAVFYDPVATYLMLGDHIFSGCSKLTKVTLPNGLSFLPMYAFQNCTNLTNVTIPESVTSVGGEAFSGCEGLSNPIVFKGRLLWAGKITDGKYTFPDGVTSIDPGAFSGRDDLVTVTIPNSISEIPEGAFSNCKKLTFVSIPESVTDIEREAFLGCSSLAHISWTCAKNLDVSKYSFSGCENITRVDFLNGTPSSPIIFGTSQPTIYIDNKEYYNGYKIVKGDVSDFPVSISLTPQNKGKIGQVLMVTTNGIEWVDIPGGYSSAIADSFQLKAGWNLVSMPETELSEECKNELLKVFEFFSFDTEKKCYCRVDILQPRTCYWVFAKESSTIHFTRLK